MSRVHAKKGLGQHFLIDKNIALKIVDGLKWGDFSTLVEVGPGTGVLTEHLLKRDVQKMIAVELDQEALDHLYRKFPDHKDKFIFHDFLKFSLDDLQTPIALLGNLPYYISSQILFKVWENKHRITQVVCMVQKEVAERIVSPPGSKCYGILSVLLQAFYNIEYLFTVHEHCFSPAPRVKSGVIRLIRNDVEELPCRSELFKSVVKSSFNQRRKIIRNSLKSIFLYLPRESGMLSMRPEQLSVEQFIELASDIEKLNT